MAFEFAKMVERQTRIVAQKKLQGKESSATGVDPERRDGAAGDGLSQGRVSFAFKYDDTTLYTNGSGSLREEELMDEERTARTKSSRMREAAGPRA